MSNYYLGPGIFRVEFRFSNSQLTFILCFSFLLRNNYFLWNCLLIYLFTGVKLGILTCLKSMCIIISVNCLCPLCIFLDFLFFFSFYGSLYMLGNLAVCHKYFPSLWLVFRFFSWCFAVWSFHSLLENLSISFLWLLDFEARLCWMLTSQKSRKKIC